MDENKIIETTETIAEVADEIAENSNGLRCIKAADVGLSMLIVGTAYIAAKLAFDYVVKPSYGKVKERIKLRKQKKSDNDEVETLNED